MQLRFIASYEGVVCVRSRKHSAPTDSVNREAAGPMPYPVEEGGYADDESEPDAETRAAPPRRRSGRGRLASRERAAK